MSCAAGDNSPGQPKRPVAGLAARPRSLGRARREERRRLAGTVRTSVGRSSLSPLRRGAADPPTGGGEAVAAHTAAAGRPPACPRRPQPPRTPAGERCWTPASPQRSAPPPPRRADEIIVMRSPAQIPFHRCCDAPIPRPRLPPHSQPVSRNRSVSTCSIPEEQKQSQQEKTRKSIERKQRAAARAATAAMHESGREREQHLGACMAGRLGAPAAPAGWGSLGRRPLWAGGLAAGRASLGRIVT